MLPHHHLGNTVTLSWQAIFFVSCKTCKTKVFWVTIGTKYIYVGADAHKGLWLRVSLKWDTCMWKHSLEKQTCFMIHAHVYILTDFIKGSVSKNFSPQQLICWISFKKANAICQTLMDKWTCLYRTILCCNLCVHHTLYLSCFCFHSGEYCCQCGCYWLIW